MESPVLLNGRELTPALLSQLALEVETRPELSRTTLAREVCEWLDWKGTDGEPKVTSCRIALARLEERGLLALPQPKGEFARPRPRLPPDEARHSPLSYALDELGELVIVPVSKAERELNRQWNELMAQHYLGPGPLVGRQIRYLVKSDHGWVAAMAFSAAAWAVADRDERIGWSRRAREANLQYVVANSRFLIPPWVKVRNLGSKLLALSARRLAEDWQKRYGYRPVLLESYIDKERFSGVCYRAANWQRVGQTSGRGRQDRALERSAPVKDIYLLALHPGWRSTLCREPGPPPPRLKQPRDWAEEEFGGASLGDERRGRRLIEFARLFYARPMASIPQACGGDTATMRAVYRWLGNEHVNINDILQPHYEATARRVAEQKTVLAVQDSTFFNYSSHHALKGAGPIGSNKDKPATGIIMHDTMTFTEQGLPLGLLDANVWARDPAEFGKKHQRRDLPIGDKESSKWIRSYKAASALQELCRDTTVLSVGDREADIYELFALASTFDSSAELLVRAEHKPFARRS